MRPAEAAARRLLAADISDLPWGDLSAMLRLLGDYRQVMRQLLVPAPRIDGSVTATSVLPDGTAWLAHDDLLLVLGALRTAAMHDSPETATRYAALSYRLGDDR